MLAVLTVLSGGALAADSSVTLADPAVTIRRSTSWLDSLRSSGRSADVRSGGDELLGDRSLTTPISQSADGAGADAFEDVAVPLGEPAEPIDSLGPVQTPDADVFGSPPASEFPESTIEDRAQSRPPMSPDRVFSQDCGRSLCWQLLPNGLLYKTYLAGEKEPRMQFVRVYDRVSKQSYDDAVLGGRLGILRHGTKGAIDPQGFQLDLEGAVFARVMPEEDSTPLAGSDYRAGLYGTWRNDRLSYRFGYYHISSHVGDEYQIANPGFVRANYVRDSALAGLAYETTLTSRIYGEMGYAVGHEGGAEPLEFQYGAEYTPVARTVATGAPFVAVNRHLREDFDFAGSWNIAAGWGWMGPQTGRRLRLGVNYYRGPSLQWVFLDQREELVGGGVWIDF